MTAEAAEDRPVLAARGDPIRIVPLYVDAELLRPLDAAGPAASARLNYRGGALLTSVKVLTIFWGPAWAQSPLKDTASRLNDFFDYVLTSTLLDQLSEYSVPGQVIGHGNRIGTATVTTPVPRSTVTDSRIQHFLQQ